MSIEDRAQEHEAQEWAIINRPREAASRFEPGAKGYGPAECEECEREMHQVRRAYGFRLCTQCQSAREPARR